MNQENWRAHLHRMTFPLVTGSFRESMRNESDRIDLRSRDCDTLETKLRNLGFILFNTNTMDISCRLPWALKGTLMWKTCLSKLFQVVISRCKYFVSNGEEIHGFPVIRVNYCAKAIRRQSLMSSPGQFSFEHFFYILDEVKDHKIL